MFTFTPLITLVVGSLTLTTTRSQIISAAKKVQLDSVFFLEGTLEGADEEDNDE